MLFNSAASSTLFINNVDESLGVGNIRESGQADRQAGRDGQIKAFSDIREELSCQHPAGSSRIHDRNGCCRSSDRHTR
jgi:hypothetical protein